MPGYYSPRHPAMASNTSISKIILRGPFGKYYLFYQAANFIEVSACYLYAPFCFLGCF
jgi:hypothetical protein